MRRHVAAIGRDVRHALRRLRLSPAYTVTTVATLAFGVALNTVLFSLANVALFRAQAVADPGQLLHVGWYAPASPGRQGLVRHAEFLDIAARDDVFSGVIAYKPFRRALRVADHGSIVVSGELVSDEYFDVLGVAAQRGRLLMASDESLGTSGPVAVISDGLWRRAFAGRDDAVGSVVHLNGTPFTIVGVAPPGLKGLVMPMVLQEDIWVPLVWARETLRLPGHVGPSQVGSDQRDGLFLVGRLAQNVSMSEAQAALQGLSFPDASGQRLRDPAAVLGLRPGAARGRHAVTTGATAIAGTLLLLGVGLLVVTSANLANLVLVRGVERRGELATRLSLGATRAHLVRYLMVEHTLVGIVAAAVALAAVAVVIPLTAHLDPPRVLGVSLQLAPVIDWRVAGYAIALAMVTIVGVGLVPSRTASRLNLADVLRGTPAYSGRLRWLHARNALTVVQVAASVILLVFAGATIATFRALQSTEVGMRTASVAVVRLDLALHGYDDDDAPGFVSRLTDTIGREPSLPLAAVTSQLPAPDAGSVGIRLAAVAGGDESTTFAGIASVSPHFFDVLGVPRLAGRVFSDIDREGTRPVAVVSHSLARRLAGSPEQVLGLQIVIQDGRDDVVHEVVGVVGDTKRRVIREGSDQVYVPFEQRPRTEMSLVARTLSSPGSATDALVRGIHEVNPDVAAIESMALTAVFERYFYPYRVSAIVLAALGFGTVALAGLGVYGVIAYSASQRTREMGIRVALGATRGQIHRLMLGDAVGIAAIGLGMGLALSVPAGALAAHVIWGLAAPDLLVWLSVVLFVVGVSLTAASLPARRAARVEPAAALRVP